MDLGVHILVIKLEIYHGHQDTILYLLYLNREPFIYLFLKLYSFTIWKLEIDRSFKLV